MVVLFFKIRIFKEPSSCSHFIVKSIHRNLMNRINGLDSSSPSLEVTRVLLLTHASHMKWQLERDVMFYFKLLWHSRGRGSWETETWNLRALQMLWGVFTLPCTDVSKANKIIPQGTKQRDCQLESKLILDFYNKMWAWGSLKERDCFSITRKHNLINGPNVQIEDLSPLSMYIVVCVSGVCLCICVVCVYV